MTIKSFILRSLYYYRKSTIFLLLGIVITSMVITGSLVIGDSLKKSLLELLNYRIGRIHWVMQKGESFFSLSLAQKMSGPLDTQVVPLTILSGNASSERGKKRVTNVQILGIEDDFWDLSLNSEKVDIPADAVLINTKLAELLELKPGDDIVIRFKKPSFLPGDAPFAQENEFMACRLKVAQIIDKNRGGNFSLKMNHAVETNIFMPRSYLAKQLDLLDKVNTLLVAQNKARSLSSKRLKETLDSCWQIEDSFLEIKILPEKNALDLRSQRLFIPDFVAEKLKDADPEANYIFSYLVNSISKGDKNTPYSILSSPPPLNSMKIKADEIVINSWLAEDLNAKEGDLLTLEYYVIEADRKLKTEKKIFKVHSVIPIKGEAFDSTLMPDFSGLADVENCRDWKAGVPIDLSQIRKQDEEYWDKYRGTPKGFISLETAQKIWGNQFGNLTAIRFKLEQKEKIREILNKRLTAEDFGFFFLDIRGIGLKSTEESVDFSQIFLGLSFFIVLSSLILTAFFFISSLEQRTTEIATLSALGFKKALIYKLLFSEGLLVCFIGGFIGVICGVVYDHIIIYALKNVWNEAVKTKDIEVYVSMFTLIKSFILGMFFSLLTIYLSLKNIFRQKIVVVQKGSGFLFFGSLKTFKVVVFLSIIIPPIIIFNLLLAVNTNNNYSQLLYFSSGLLSLIEGTALSYIFIKKVFLKSAKFNLISIALKNLQRKIGRSIAIIMMLAIGIFIIISISNNRQDFSLKEYRRNSGTGGFTFFCRTTHPINKNLNVKKNKERFFLNKKLFSKMKFVSFRLRQGDEASCLNLNRGIEPQLLGVNPQELLIRKAFAFSKILPEYAEMSKDIWSLLDQKLEDGFIPVIADQAVIRWSLGKSLGDSLTYINEKSETVKLKFVAGLTNSILQGYVIMSEKHFVKNFPSIGGFNVFLVENFSQNKQEIRDELYNSLLNYGVEVTDTLDRLYEFKSVENTYLSIFTVLGGFGLILGTFGLSILLIRDIRERKGELALLKTLGFSKVDLINMLSYEYLCLLFLGITIGNISGLLSTIGVWSLKGAQLPYFLLTTILLLIILNGTISICSGAKFSLRGNLIKSLGNE